MGVKTNAGADVQLQQQQGCSSLTLPASSGECQAYAAAAERAAPRGGCRMLDVQVPGLLHASSISSSSDPDERMGEERSAGSGLNTTNPTTTTTINTDSSTALYDDRLPDGLQGLTLKSGEKEIDSAPEGIAAAAVAGVEDDDAPPRSGVESPPELSRQPDDAICMGVDYAALPQPVGHASTVAAADDCSSQQVLRGFDLPPLQLPDQTMMDSEFAGLHHHHHHHHLHHPGCASAGATSAVGHEADYATASHHFGLPANLAISPSCHDGKVLDPNAREFTPSPSPCPSPVLSAAGLLHMGVPPPYPIDPTHLYAATGVEAGGRMVYSSADYGAGPMIPLYGNGAPLTYPVSAGAAVPTPSWENLGMPSDMGHAQGAGSPHLPVQPHALQRSFGRMQPFMSMGLPTLATSSGALVSHPTITGREHVSRAILLNGVPSDMDDAQLRREMEQWGPVRALGYERRSEGLVTVHYYDLRHAKEALRDIQQQHLNKQQRMQQQFQLSHKQRFGPRGGEQQHTVTGDPSAYERQDSAGKQQHSDLLLDNPHRDIVGSSTSAASTRGLIGGTVMWAQYTVPVGAAAGPDGVNQGTLVVFNLDVDITMDQLKAAFEVYGPVKELRETPAKKQHKFVEFFDVRDAAVALKALDETEMFGNVVKIEFSRPGGQAHKARVQAQQAQTQQQQQQGMVFPLGRGGSRSSLAGSGPGPVGVQPMFWNGDAVGAPPPLAMAGAHAGPPYLWTNLGSIAGGTPVSPLGMVQPQHWNSGASQLQPFPYPTMHGGPPSPGQVVVMDHLPFGRAAAAAAAGRAMGMGGYSGGGGLASAAESYASGQGFGRAAGTLGGGQGRGGGGEGASSRRKRNATANGNAAGYGKDGGGRDAPGSKLSMRDSPRGNKSGVTSKCGSSSREAVPVQYVFDEGEVQANETSRTTLMIKNIPNKYSQQMLLQLLDQHCSYCNLHLEDPSEPESAYDFVYLPIDFKNRCNLGYAFVNFTTVQATIRLYKAFHAQQWEAFNSRKICHVTYARVQGRAALEEHFKNSRFACDTDDYLPLIFPTPRNGKNSSTPATVAAVHQSSRVLSSSAASVASEHGRVPRNGESEYAKRVTTANGNSCASQDLEMELPCRGSTSSSSPSGSHRSAMPQPHR